MPEEYTTTTDAFTTSASSINFPATREIELVKKLAASIGYDNIMRYASALWHRELMRHGDMKGIGCYLPVCLDEIKKLKNSA